MTRNKRIWLALFCILLLVSGCGRPKEQPVEPKTPLIAVVDWETISRAHPLAGAWRQKQADRLAAQRALAFKDDLLRQQQYFDDSMTNNRRLYSNAVLQTKMAESTAKKREMLLVWEHGAKEEMEAVWRRTADEIEDKYRPDLANLQLKLAVLNLPKEDKKQLEAAHAQVLQQRDKALRDKRRELETQLAQRRLSTDDGVTAAQVADFLVALVFDGLRPREPVSPAQPG